MSTPTVLKIIFLILVSVAAILEAAGDVVLKKWAISGKPTIFIIGLIIYFVATIIWPFH